MSCLVLQVDPLYVYIYSPERLNNTSIIFRQSLSPPTLLHQEQPERSLSARATPGETAAAARAPGGAVVGDVVPWRQMWKKESKREREER
jgi:hypothetical protein